MVIGAAALMGATTAAFAGTRGFGHFTDAAGSLTACGPCASFIVSIESTWKFFPARFPYDAAGRTGRRRQR